MRTQFQSRCLCPGFKIFRVVERICRVRKTQERLINNWRKDDDLFFPESARKTYTDCRLAPAVRHQDLIFFSGVVGEGESAEEEFRSACASFEVTRAEAGIGYEDIIDTTLYIVDLQKNASTMAKVRNEFMKEPYPASTRIGITELVIPEARAEIKVIARTP